MDNYFDYFFEANYNFAVSLYYDYLLDCCHFDSYLLSYLLAVRILFNCLTDTYDNIAEEDYLVQSEY